MGRPYLEKYADVKWEIDDKHLQAWKDGKTGVPIVDAVSFYSNIFVVLPLNCYLFRP